jgi:hypothetical protein
MVPYLDLIESQPKGYRTLWVSGWKCTGENGIEGAKDAETSLVVSRSIAKAQNLNLHMASVAT